MRPHLREVILLKNTDLEKMNLKVRPHFFGAENLTLNRKKVPFLCKMYLFTDFLLKKRCFSGPFSHTKNDGAFGFSNIALKIRVL